MKREPVTIEAGEGKPAKAGRKKPIPPNNPNPKLYELSPHYKAGKMAADSGQQMATVNASGGNASMASLLTYQALSLNEVGYHLLDAAKYLGAVASGRKKGEQWRMRAAESLLDRGGVTGSTVERAQIAAQAAAQGGADLGAMLDKLVAARQFAARKASATDAETGQISGTPQAD